MAQKPKPQKPQKTAKHRRPARTPPLHLAVLPADIPRRLVSRDPLPRLGLPRLPGLPRGWLREQAATATVSELRVRVLRAGGSEQRPIRNHTRSGLLPCRQREGRRVTT